MARSYGAVKVSVWEVTSDFRRLELAAQWGYMMLISQPQLNNLGVLPYAPEKWHRFAADINRDALHGIIDQLVEHHYVVVDTETDELLVRTFIKHDKVWAQPKLVTNARRLIREVESQLIRDTLTARHPWLIDTSDKAQIEHHETTPALWKDPDTPVETPSHTPTAETPNGTPIETPSDTHIPTRARPGPGQGQGPGVGESSSSSSSSDSSSTARDTNDPDDATAADDHENLERLLDELAIPGSLRTRALADPERALAVARYTTANKGGGAYFRTVFESGDWPTVTGAGSRARAQATTTNGSGRGVGYIRGLIDNGVIGQMFELDEELAHATVTTAEREGLRARIRELFTSLDGWRLPADELEQQLAELGADDDELVGLLELAADLRGAG